MTLYTYFATSLFPPLKFPSKKAKRENVVSLLSRR